MSRAGRWGLGAVGLALIAACGPHDAAAPAAQAAASVDSLLARGEQVYLRGEFDSAAAILILIIAIVMACEYVSSIVRRRIQ